MRTFRINKAISYLAPSLISTGLILSSTAWAMPMQSTASATSKSVKETTLPARTETGTKSTVLVRNTTAEAKPAPATAQKEPDKKTISRCWKRLMNMAREVSHARRTKTT